MTMMGGWNLVELLGVNASGDDALRSPQRASQRACGAVSVGRCVAVEREPAPVKLTGHALLSVTGGSQSGAAPQVTPTRHGLPSIPPPLPNRPSAAMSEAAAPPVYSSPQPSRATSDRSERSAASGSAIGSRPPAHRLFRQAALDAHHGPEPELDALAVPRRGAWGMLLVLVSLVVLLFVGAAVAEIEVTVKATGTLRAPSGLRSVESLLAGAVSQVLVAPGDGVESGQVVVRLEDAKLRSNLVLKERELSLMQQDTDEASRADRVLLDEALRVGERQRVTLEQRQRISRAQLARRSARLNDMQSLVAYGAASKNDAFDTDESVQAALQQVAALGSQLLDLDLSIADRLRAWQERELERRSAIGRSNAVVEEARSLLGLVEVRSPAAGRIESLMARVGDVVSAGEVMAQVVPVGAPRIIVAFLQSRETAFVRVGGEANIEVESLSVNEFGTARGRVLRVSSDVAQPEEMAAVSGAVLPGAHVRVELELLPDAAHEKMARHLRSGERVVVRLHTRKRRVLGILFDFARKWVEQ
jgi:multidrug efflux pump subunit AcrA (membrane-fusion protein)